MAKVEVGPSLQSTADRHAQTKKQAEIGAEPLKVRMLIPCSMRGAIELFQCAPAVNQVIGKAISEADTDSAAGFPASPPVEAHAGPNVWRPLPVLAKGPAKPINQSYGQNQDHVLPIAPAHFVSQEPD